jgi:short chain dehydrogenase/FAD binding domain in molybdopterin dehydrogenase/CO dehydrogenase flavoprotein C-terminal domain
VLTSVEQFGSLDILVNNAGLIRRAPAVDYRTEDWDHLIAADLSSVFRLSQLAGRHMLERGQGGKIVNIASLLSFQGGILVPAYAAAKGGVAQLTKALQDARCWYYRAGWPCYRAGGNICYADTPAGRNREHAILHAERCVAVNPSDTAPALIALDAKFVVRSSKGERVINAEDYFLGPDIDITRMNVLQPGDLLTSIRIPSTWAGSQFYSEKIRDRNVWDFPLLNVASAMKLSGDTIQDVRVSVNAAAARPLRLNAVEQAVRGHARNA